jgi:hypothetical protein
MVAHTCNPSYMVLAQHPSYDRGIGSRITVPGPTRQNREAVEEITKVKGLGVWLKHLPGESKALSSNPSATKKKVFQSVCYSTILPWDTEQCFAVNQWPVSVAPSCALISIFLIVTVTRCLTETAYGSKDSWSTALSCTIRPGAGQDCMAWERVGRRSFPT